MSNDPFHYMTGGRKLTEMQLHKLRKLYALGYILIDYDNHRCLPKDYCNSESTVIRACSKLTDEILEELIDAFLVDRDCLNYDLINQVRTVTFNKLSLESTSAYLILSNWFESWNGKEDREVKRIIMRNAIDLIHSLNILTAKAIHHNDKSQ